MSTVDVVVMKAELAQSYQYHARCSFVSTKACGAGGAGWEAVLPPGVVMGAKSGTFSKPTDRYAVRRAVRRR